MIGTIRKHSKWLWLVIVTVTIFTFVYWGSSPSQYDRTAGGMQLGVVSGIPVTEDDYMKARQEVYLRYFLQNGRWPDRAARQFDERRETYYRIFFLRTLEDHDIEVDTTSVAQEASNILRAFGGGKPVPLETFTKQLLNPQGIAAEDFQRFLRHELAIQQLVSIIGTSGRLVTVDEARMLLERESREIASDVVLFNASNYLARVSAPTEDMLKQFYIARSESEYRIPERVQVKYVAFSITNQFPEITTSLTNLSELVDGYMKQIGTNYTQFGETPEKVRSLIRDDIIRSHATTNAVREANSFADALLSMDTLQATNLESLARQRNLTPRVTKPFTREQGPSEFDGGPNFGTTAFLLTPEDPIASQPLVGDSAVYIIALDKTVPSEVPPLAELHDKVLADYKLNQARGMARNAAAVFVNAATNALSSGVPFKTVAADNKVNPVSLSPFSMSSGSIPELEGIVNPGRFKQYAFDIPVGKISDSLPTDQGALVIYIEKELPLDEARIQARLPQFVDAIRRARQGEALNSWFAKEAPRALRTIQFEDEQRSQSGPSAP